jgi:C4-type Zn-finger protein
VKNVEDKLDKINERLDDIVKVQIEQAADLKHHIYRSDLNEENIELLRADVKPVIKMHEQINAGLKIVGGIAVLAGIARTIIEIIKFVS